MVDRLAIMVLSGLLNLGNRWFRLVEVRLTWACSPNMLHPLSRRLRTNMWFLEGKAWAVSTLIVADPLTLPGLNSI